MSHPFAATKPVAASPPLCEGWLEKYALCRGMFSRKGWCCRYAFATHEGLGLCHTNPREKGSYNPERPLNRLHAKTFIPFAKKRHGEVVLRPVYIIEDVSAARHPEIPQKSCNGICSETVSCTEVASNIASTGDLNRISSTLSSCTYYYFGLTFEEDRTRYLLLLRTSSPQDYIRWTTVLPLYVHQGSASRIVPQGHPLEVGRSQPIDVNHKRLTQKRESKLPDTATFYPDPDPCSLQNYARIRRACLRWDEGERERLFATAEGRVRSLCGGSEGLASESIAEMLDRSVEDYRNGVVSQFDRLSPVLLPDDQALHSLQQAGNSSECGSSVASSGGVVAGSSVAVPSRRHQVGVTEVGCKDSRLVEGSKQRTVQRLFLSFPSIDSGQHGNKRNLRLEKGGTVSLMHSHAERVVQ